MSVAQIVGLLVKACVLSTVFALGLNTRWKDLTHLFSTPGLFLRSLLAMYVLTPLIAVVLALAAPAPLTIKVAVLLMAISAGAPALPKKLLKLDANPQYVRSLSVTTTLLAIATVPLSLTALGAFFGRDVSVDIGQVAAKITLAYLAPLLAGMVVRSVALTLAERMAGPILNIAGVTLLVLIVLIVATSFSAIVGVGLPGLATIALMTSASLAIGHVLGGPDPNDRTTLAVACATRFPGIGLLIAAQNFPKTKPLPVVVVYVLISTLTVLPYWRWRKSQHAAQVA
ncbi:MAG: bile acid:sodium symporter family protein [Steroidobacteraceae bacterium]